MCSDGEVVTHLLLYGVVIVLLRSLRVSVMSIHFDGVRILVSVDNEVCVVYRSSRVHLRSDINGGSFHILSLCSVDTGSRDLLLQVVVSRPCCDFSV